MRGTHFKVLGHAGPAEAKKLFLQSMQKTRKP